MKMTDAAVFPGNAVGFGFSPRHAMTSLMDLVTEEKQTPHVTPESAAALLFTVNTGFQLLIEELHVTRFPLLEDESRM